MQSYRMNQHIVYWFQYQNMKPKYQKRTLREISSLSPWQTDVDQPCIDRYCSEFIYNSNRPPNDNLPKINRSKRAASHCSKPNPAPNYQKTTYRSHYQTLTDNYMQTYHIMSLNKTERADKKRAENRVPLQEVNVKNFVAEGGHHGSLKPNKRDSSYVMKQKFAEFRRSERAADYAKENKHRIMRYQ